MSTATAPGVPTRAAHRVAAALADAWNAHDAAAVAALYAGHAVRHEHAAPAGVQHGRDEVAWAVADVMSCLGGLVVVPRSAQTTAHGLVLEWSLQGTVARALPGRTVVRGRRVHVDGVSLLRLRGGEVAEEHLYWDASALR